MLKHLACIMDGNRRWAQKKGWLSARGHKEGAINAIPRVVDFCIEKEIKYLSLYAWALENKNRSLLEREYLFGPLAQEMYEKVDNFVQKGIRIKFMGRRDLFSASLVEMCHDIEMRTKDLDVLHLNFFIWYSGREEIMHAVQRLARRVQMGILRADQVTAKDLEQEFYTAGMPDPELIIRTGGHQRLSDFLLYQSSYSELYFLDCLWPDIQKDDLENALIYYQRCKRNFGV